MATLEQGGTPCQDGRHSQVGETRRNGECVSVRGERAMGTACQDGTHCQVGETCRNGECVPVRGERKQRKSSSRNFGGADVYSRSFDGGDVFSRFGGKNVF